MEKQTAVFFTRNELEILDAAFEVLAESGLYAVLQVPHIVYAHQRLYGKFHDALSSDASIEAEQEHLPTLEGVIDYLERENDLAFLAYRRLSGGSEPGMHAAVRARLTGEAFSIWTGVGEALYKAKEAAKNPGLGVTYIDTINRLLDKHFGAKVR